MIFKVKFNVGALRHFDHGCGLFPHSDFDTRITKCHLCNQAWNWHLQKIGKPLIPLQDTHKIPNTFSEGEIQD